MPRTPGSRAAPWVLAAVSLVIALGGAELALDALALPARPGPLAWKTSVPWSEGVNALGFRGKGPRPRKRRHRILLLGDSQLEGYHLVRQDLFAAMLQRFLRRRDWSVEVIALGAGGWGTDQQLLALREYADRIQPDQVVVFYTFQNDIWNTLFPTHMGTPKPTFRLQGDALVPPDPALWRAPHEAPDAARAHHGLRALLRRAVTGYPGDADWEAFLPPPRTAAPAGPHVPSLAESYEQSHGLALWDGEDLHHERSHFSHLVEPPSPRMQHALRLQRALFAEMQRECAARGIPLHVFRTMLTIDAWEGTWAHDGRAYTLSARAATARLRALFASLGIPLLEIDDLTPEQTWLPKDAHLNPRGNRHVAERVGRWLLAERTRDAG